MSKTRVFLDELKDFALEKGYALARMKGVFCPECKEKLILPPVMLSGFVFGEPTDADTGEPTSKWMILFFVPFLAIGVGVLYAGLRTRYTEVLVLLDGE